MKRTAQDFFDMCGFGDGIRTPRSAAYKAGVLALLKYRMREAENCPCPYAAGTADCDAFFAGMEEGWWYVKHFNADRRKGKEA